MHDRIIGNPAGWYLSFGHGQLQGGRQRRIVALMRRLRPVRVLWLWPSECRDRYDQLP